MARVDHGLCCLAVPIFATLCYSMPIPLPHICIQSCVWSASWSVCCCHLRPSGRLRPATASSFSSLAPNTHCNIHKKPKRGANRPVQIRGRRNNESVAKCHTPLGDSGCVWLMLNSMFSRFSLCRAIIDRPLPSEAVVTIVAYTYWKLSCIICLCTLRRIGA